MAFEADLPRIEGGQCRLAGVGCLLLPTTDKGTPVAFYPFFSAFQNGIGDRQGNGSDDRSAAALPAPSHR